MPENKTSGGYICKRSGILLNSRAVVPTAVVAAGIR